MIFPFLSFWRVVEMVELIKLTRPHHHHHHGQPQKHNKGKITMASHKAQQSKPK